MQDTNVLIEYNILMQYNNIVNISCNIHSVDCGVTITPEKLLLHDVQWLNW